MTALPSLRDDALRAAKPEILERIRRLPHPAVVVRGRRRRCVIVLDPVLADAILTDGEGAFTKGAATKDFRFLVGDGTGPTPRLRRLPPGAGADSVALWRRQRRVAIAAAFKAGARDTYETELRAAAEAVLESLREPRVAVDAVALGNTAAVRLSLACFAPPSLRERLAELAGVVQETQWAVDRSLDSSWRWPLDRDFTLRTRLLQALPDATSRAMRRRRRAFVDLAGAARANVAEGDAHLFARLAHAAQRHRPRERDAIVRAGWVGLLLASYDNSATTIAWALWELAGREELQEELAADAAPAASYERVVSEVLRKHPPVWSTLREATRPVTVGRLRFPAETSFALMPWLLHRRDELWAEPDRFDERRFLEQPRPGSYFPFGRGRGNCVARAFVLEELSVFLHALLRRYRVRRLAATPPAAVLGVVQRPGGPIPLELAART